MRRWEDPTRADLGLKPGKLSVTSTQRGSRPTDVLRRAAQHVCLYVLLVSLGCASLVWNLVATLLLVLPVLPQPRAQRLGRTAIAYIYRAFWTCSQAVGMMRIDTRAIDALRDEPGGLIIAANHPASLDALLIVARLPRAVCVMKAGLRRNVFLGPATQLARYIRNDTPRVLIRRAVDTLQEGGQLVLFPEGTRTRVGARLDPLQPGVTLIAHLARVPIQVVVIETDSPYLRKGWPIWRLPPLPVAYRLRLGARIEPGSDHRLALQRLHDDLSARLGG